MSEKHDRTQPAKRASGSHRGEILPLQAIEPGDGKLVLSLKLPSGASMTKGAHHKVVLTTSSPDAVSFQGWSGVSRDRPEFPLEVTITGGSGTAMIKAAFFIYYCIEGGGSCMLAQGAVEVPVRAESGSGKRRVEVQYEIKQAAA